MTQKVENINTEILRKCREQMGLELFEVARKVKKIEAIENGEHLPTFKQIDILAALYKVPRWVFIMEKLPVEYQFDKAVPAFRHFLRRNPSLFSDSKIRGITTQVERFRELILELQQDVDADIQKFCPPPIDKGTSPEKAASLIRKWLGIKDEKPDFDQWKSLLENQGIFVFLTSKYTGWSHVNKDFFRGLSIFHPVLPIIIINNSDFKKAHAFTLFHELAHLLRKESSIDEWAEGSRIEKWCDSFSGNVLMPSQLFRDTAGIIFDLNKIKSVAGDYSVSPYACLVRMKQLRLITPDEYELYQQQLIKEYEVQRKKLKESDGGPSRNRAQEALSEYGHIYSRIVFQAYHNGDIGLHKVAKLFDLKQPSYVFELQGLL